MSDETQAVTGAVTENTQDEPVSFTEAQQAKVQELIDKAHAKAMAKADKATAALRAELDALKSQKQAETTFDADAARKLLADTEAQYKAQIAQMLDGQKAGLLMAAASKANAVNPEVVAKLVADAVVYEDGAFTIHENGKARLNSRMQPMTVDEYVAAYLEANPYLKRPANTGGAGSSTKPGSGGQAQARPSNWDQAAAQFKQLL